MDSSSSSSVYIPLFSHDNGQVRYNILSLKPKTLLQQQWQPPELLVSAELKNNVDLYPFMGCGTLESKIILAGGKEAYFKSLNMNSYVIAFDTSEAKTRVMDPDCSIGPMIAGKGDALVAEIDRKVYVLNGTKYFGGIDNPFFEVYDPLKKRWDDLPDPPFASMKVSGDLPHHFSSFSFDNKIFISMPGMNPMYFDTQSCKWIGQCKLFEGRNFPFRNKGAASFYDSAFKNDFALICFTEQGDLTAYRVLLPNLSCKATETQVLNRSGCIVPSSFHRMSFSGCFADFGGGVFCLASTIDDEQISYGDVALCLTTFRVSRVPHEGAFLEFKMLSHYRYSYYQLGDQIGKIMGCFAL